MLTAATQGKRMPVESEPWGMEHLVLTKLWCGAFAGRNKREPPIQMGGSRSRSSRALAKAGSVVAQALFFAPSSN